MFVCSQYTPEGHLFHVKSATLLAQLLLLMLATQSQGNRAILSPDSFFRKLFWHYDNHLRQTAYEDRKST